MGGGDCINIFVCVGRGFGTLKPWARRELSCPLCAGIVALGGHRLRNQS